LIKGEIYTSINLEKESFSYVAGCWLFVVRGTSEK
jgi:hypothetical protein